ncbi:DUF397 domain-containing protein [Streptosporangium carneum]|uniref:DUF397 domain-containing protein n=1 Tax=Streptosporangium carneum TaxID=47481 RepID=A0A9W6HZB3_9ACTN|nr:DUF397 domain-containing protein [Streptosporangium carneum]GLK08414.1 DUF397 domain-containing protein [Streptosporangium carneum]
MDDLSRELAAARWRKSSLSGHDGGDCVEVAALSGGCRAVRDTKDRTGPALVLTAEAWAAFSAAIKAERLG